MPHACIQGPHACHSLKSPNCAPLLLLTSCYVPALPCTDPLRQDLTCSLCPAPCASATSQSMSLRRTISCAAPTASHSLWRRFSRKRMTIPRGGATFVAVPTACGGLKRCHRRRQTAFQNQVSLCCACRWENLALGYTEARGLPALREEIARCVLSGTLFQPSLPRLERRRRSPQQLTPRSDAERPDATPPSPHKALHVGVARRRHHVRP